MSLAHSKGDPKGDGAEGWELLSSRKSEKKARSLSQPNHTVDTGIYGTHSINVNGNTKPQEAPYLQRRPSNSKVEPRMSGHIHEKPWSMCMAPGRKENPHHTNPHHRVWIADAGRQGRPYDGIDEREDLGVPRRWNRARKKEHYDKFESELYKLKPHDELFAVRTNMKFWTHLADQGMHAGGQEKLEYVPKRTGAGWSNHLKGSNYMGRFTNVRHAQMILASGRKNSKGEPDEWAIDTRPMFDNRLHDDMVRYNDNNDVKLAQMAFGFSRPLNTRSCPQMGADYMHR